MKVPLSLLVASLAVGCWAKPTTPSTTTAEISQPGNPIPEKAQEDPTSSTEGPVPVKNENTEYPTEATWESTANTDAGPYKKQTYSTPSETLSTATGGYGEEEKAQSTPSTTPCPEGEDCSETPETRRKRQTDAPYPTEEPTTTTGGYKAKKLQTASTPSTTTEKILEKTASTTLHPTDSTIIIEIGEEKSHSTSTAAPTEETEEVKIQGQTESTPSTAPTDVTEAAKSQTTSSVKPTVVTKGVKPPSTTTAEPETAEDAAAVGRMEEDLAKLFA